MSLRPTDRPLEKTAFCTALVIEFYYQCCLKDLFKDKALLLKVNILISLNGYYRHCIQILAFVYGYKFVFPQYE